MRRRSLGSLGIAVLFASVMACDPHVAFAGEHRKEAAARPKSIRDRFVPPVAGIDLEQALNYTDSEGLDLAWFYDSFTYPRVFYKRGSRPYLEKIVWERTKPDAPPMARLRACVAVVESRMPHYIRLGYKGATDRAMTEEELLRSGHGWCNEQARVLAALTQIAGLPSRLVFAQSRDGKAAHVVTEVHVDGKWVLVDQTEGLVALGTVRVQRTTGMMGEVAGMAASLCKRHDVDPRGVYEKRLDELKGLMRRGVPSGARPLCNRP